MLGRHIVVALLLAGAASQQPAPPNAAQVQLQPPGGTSEQPPADAWHYITVSFNYDFSKTPPCSSGKPKHPCVARFGLYETTAGTDQKHRILLFYAPLPANPRGVVQVTLNSPQKIDFVLGWHKLGVAALEDDSESSMKFCDSCATWINVQAGPSTSPSSPAPGSSSAPPANASASPAPPRANH